MTAFISQCSEKLYEKLGFEVHRNEGFTFSQTYLPHPLLNGVFDSRKCANLELSIQEVHNHFLKLALPFCWWIEDIPENNELQALLLQKGCKSIGDFPGMIHNLEHIPKANLPIQQLASAKELKEWGNVISQAFNLGADLNEEFSSLFDRSENGLHHFICRDCGQPVSTGSLLISNGIAFIYNIATLPSLQSKGYGTELMLGLLHFAKENNCSQVVLQSSPAGIKLYKKIGFEMKNSYKIFI